MEYYEFADLRLDGLKLREYRIEFGQGYVPRPLLRAGYFPSCRLPRLP